MASNMFTNGTEEKVLDWVFRIGSPARPAASPVVALFTTTPTSDAGTGGVECSGSGYSRQAATFSRSAQTVSLASDITFGPATSSWGTINGFAIYDGSSTMLAFNSLTSAKSVGSGDSAKFTTSNLTITLD
jgi:hypothetical protein